MNEKIDFVVTWLDSSDSIWQKQYYQYKGITTKGDQSSARFRDWDLFNYWFRAIDSYAPWVNKVFLVTNGTFPKWINKNHPKLVLVKHSDFIPDKYLPTFNSITIEMFMHRIPGLSEHFVYFNDDFYVNAPISPAYYFRNGLPCDCNAETFFNVPKYNPINKFNIYISILMDLGVVNAHFDRSQVWKQSPKRWFGGHLGMLGFLNSFILLLYKRKRFVGFNWRHTEQPYLKSIFEDAWSKEPELLEASCTRFREEVTLNPYFFRYWQFALNRFYPTTLKNTKKYTTTKEIMPKILSSIMNPRIKSLCINDTPLCTDEEFSEYKEAIHQVFEKKFPKKSSYEL